MDLLKKNFKLSLWLTRLLFVVTSIFGKLFEYSATLGYLGEQFSWDVSLYASFWGVVAWGFLSSVITLVILTWFSNWIFRYTRIHNLPVYELTLFVVLFGCLKNTLAGLLKLTYLITPLLIGWGQVLFEALALVVAVICFYFFIQKHYLPTGNRAPFFNTILMVTTIFLAVQLIYGVLMYI